MADGQGEVDFLTFYETINIEKRILLNFKDNELFGLFGRFLSFLSFFDRFFVTLFWPDTSAAAKVFLVGHFHHLLSFARTLRSVILVTAISQRD